MHCKKHIYQDGDYTLCSWCPEAQECADAKRCYVCGKIDGVFYHHTADLFLCGTCLRLTEDENGAGKDS